MVRVREVPSPTVGSRDVLVRVFAASVNSGDARIRGARFPRGFGVLARAAIGFTRPRQPVLGVALAGVIEVVGDAVTEWNVGDRVAAMTGVRMGSHAELAAVRADRLAHVPPTVEWAAAAGALFGGTTAIHFVQRLGNVRAGSDVLVVGGSGAVGTSAIQLARAAGATVSATSSHRNFGLLERLGATPIDSRTRLADLPGGFDLVVDTVGLLHPRDAQRLIRGDGVLALVAADLKDTLAARGRVRAGTAPENAEDVATLLGMLERGELETVIDRDVALEEIASLHALVDSGRKVGNAIVRPHTE